MKREKFSEYPIEGIKDPTIRTPVDLKKLEAGRLPKKIYLEAHKGLVITCHDVFIKYKSGILLVERDNLPGKGEIWPIGGRVSRGVLVEDSLREIAFKECGLKIANLKLLGFGRTISQTDPFGHGKGTDTINLAYYATSKGTINLDKFHKNPIIMTKSKYRNSRKTLHPYVVQFLDKIFS